MARIQRWQQTGTDLFTVGTDLDLDLSSVDLAQANADGPTPTEDPSPTVDVDSAGETLPDRRGLDLVLAQVQHLINQIDDAGVDGHARAVAEAAACQRLTGVLEAAKALAIRDAYITAEESLIEQDAAPGGYRKHGVRTEEDSSDTYVTRRQLTVDDIGPALGLHTGLANVVLDQSLRLVRHMPHALRYAASGEWNMAQVRAALRAVDALTDEQAADADAKVIAGIGNAEVSMISRRLTKWVARECQQPDVLDRDQEDAQKDRTVSFGQPDMFGMSWISIYTSAHDAALIRTALRDYADQAPEDDPRTQEQRLHDVLLAWFHGPVALAPHAAGQLGLAPVVFDAGGMPRSADPEQYAMAQETWQTIVLLMATLSVTMPAPPKTTLNVHVPLATLLALRAGIMPGTGPHAPPPNPAESDDPTEDAYGTADHTCGPVAAGSEPPEPHAWMDGLGLIGHSILLRLLSREPDLRRIITDDLTGVPINYGPLVRHPSTAMRARVQARDRTCRFPGCRRHAVPIGTRQADLDHADPHRADGSGGDTSDANLIVLCRRHHRVKHQTPWQPELRPDGAVVWRNTLLGWTIVRPRTD